MSQIYFSSDFHYNHENLVKGCTTWEDLGSCRDFNTLEEHNQKLVDSINNTVKANDRLYFLGDWSMGGKDEVINFRKRVKCKNIHFILGNHDIHVDKNYNKCQDLFNSVKIYDDIQIGKSEFILMHYPIYSWHRKKSTKHSSIHLHGHTHKELDYHPSALCVCIDTVKEFRPLHIEEIRDIINKRYEKSGMEGRVKL